MKLKLITLGALATTAIIASQGVMACGNGASSRCNTSSNYTVTITPPRIVVVQPQRRVVHHQPVRHYRPVHRHGARPIHRSYHRPAHYHKPQRANHRPQYNHGNRGGRCQSRCK